MTHHLTWRPRVHRHHPIRLLARYCGALACAATALGLIWVLVVR